jgi:hypothetical protein
MHKRRRREDETDHPQLAETDRPDVRHCERCQSEVYFCVTDEETIAHAKAGHCIAREGPDQAELPTIVVGKPVRVPEPNLSQSEALDWKIRELNVDDSIRNATRWRRGCPRCSYPAPDWRVACRVCGFQMGRATGSVE